MLEVVDSSPMTLQSVVIERSSSIDCNGLGIVAVGDFENRQVKFSNKV